MSFFCAATWGLKLRRHFSKLKRSKGECGLSPRSSVAPVDAYWTPKEHEVRSATMFIHIQYIVTILCNVNICERALRGQYFVRPVVLPVFFYLHFFSCTLDIVDNVHDKLRKLNMVVKPQNEPAAEYHNKGKSGYYQDITYYWFSRS